MLQWEQRLAVAGTPLGIAISRGDSRRTRLALDAPGLAVRETT
jgi:hypothetical protein